MKNNPLWSLVPCLMVAVFPAGCVLEPVAGNADGARKTHGPHAKAVEEEPLLFEFEDPEGSTHMVQLIQSGTAVRGDISKYISFKPGDRVYSVKFVGKVVSGLGTDRMKVQVTLPIEGHNVDVGRDGKCVWILSPGRELKVPMALPIGRTGLYEVMTFHAQSYN